MQKTSNKKIIAVFTIVLLHAFVPAMVQAQFAGGSGTANDPWQIETAAHLNNIRDYLGEEHSDKHFLQTSDIDLDVPPFNQEAGWQPIGDGEGEGFHGTYNGGRFIISGLTINRVEQNFVGLFGFVQGGTVLNVGLVDVSILAASVSGAVAGMNNGTVSNSFSSGLIQGNEAYIGGIVGYNRDEISDCFSVATVSSRCCFAGIAGMNEGTVTNSYFAGYFEPYEGVAEPNRCGIIGEGQPNVTNSYWNTDLTEVQNSQFGATGLATAQLVQQDSFEGWNFDEIWTIEENLSYPKLQWIPEEFGHIIPGPAGLTANPADEIINLTWEAPDAAPQGYNIYRDGQRINEVLIEETAYRDTGLTNWEFYEYFVRAVYDDNESLPSASVRAAPVLYAGGSGTEDDPFIINSAEQLSKIIYAAGRQFLQADDIDLGVPPWNENQGWQPIGSNERRFTGTYNGDHHLITGLTIGRDDLDQGLFGFIDGALISNVIVEDAEIDGAIRNAGGIAGNVFNSTIENSSFEGTIRASSFVGGIAGRVGYDSAIRSCYSTGSVTATGDNSYIGGLVGDQYASDIADSYSMATVNGGSMTIGGLVGRTHDGNMDRCYSIGAVNAVNPQINIGGLIGHYRVGLVNLSYWNTETSGADESPGGEPRNTAQMTYPYDRETYIDWDFDGMWREDRTGEINNGYPYLHWQPLPVSPYPDTASEPNPEHRADNITADLEQLRWSYSDNPLFSEPVGFRVYLNTTGEFNDDDGFEWVAYTDGQQNYSNSDILPDTLNYNQTYYWKVVPTTEDPNRYRQSFSNTEIRQSRRSRNDAQDVPVWQFTTELNPNPKAAESPDPQNYSEDVSVDLDYLSWEYSPHQDYTDPLGFRVYFNDSDDFSWIPYLAGQTAYECDELLPERLDFAADYYWKVVPTTEAPDQRRDRSRPRSIRGDAQGVPVWSFTTVESNPYPLPAVNPDPEHLAEGISLGLGQVSWDYKPCEHHAEPVGFRVYMNTTGVFGSNAPYVWVDYDDEQTTHSSSDVLPVPLEEETTYYWRVVSTTDRPGENGDSENPPIWNFTTGTTNTDNHLTDMTTQLYANYPNPFNPETAITFSLDEEQRVLLEVFDNRGRKIISLLDNVLPYGRHRIVWGGYDEHGNTVSSGVYLYRLKTSGYIESRSMILIK